LVQDESLALRTILTTVCARVEHRLGHYEQAHARLVSELGGLPEPISAEAVDLLIELALNEFYRSHYHSMYHWAQRAVSAAAVLEDPSRRAAALAMPALACAMTGAGGPGQSCRTGAASLVDSLADSELSRRLDAAAWLAAAELYLDRYAEADAHASRGLALARATGQGELFLVLYQILGRAWYVRGKLTEATELLDGAIEAARPRGPGAGPGGDPVQPPRRGGRHRRPRHRHDHRTGERRPRARPRRRFRAGVGGRQARRGPPRNRAARRCRRVAPQPRWGRG